MKKNILHLKSHEDVCLWHKVVVYTGQAGRKGAAMPDTKAETELPREPGLYVLGEGREPKRVSNLMGVVFLLAPSVLDGAPTPDGEIAPTSTKAFMDPKDRIVIIPMSGMPRPMTYEEFLRLTMFCLSSHGQPFTDQEASGGEELQLVTFNKAGMNALGHLYVEVLYKLDLGRPDIWTSRKAQRKVVAALVKYMREGFLDVVYELDHDSILTFVTRIKGGWRLTFVHKSLVPDSNQGDTEPTTEEGKASTVEEPASTE
jgi:hypothetical protein